MNNHKDFKKWIPPFILSIILIIFVQTLNHLPDIIYSIQAFFGALTPFILGAILAYILNIPRKKFDSLFKNLNLPFISTRHRGLSVIATYLLAIFIFRLFIDTVVPILIDGILDLGRILPVHIEALIENAMQIYNYNYLNLIFLDSIDFDLQGFILNVVQTITNGLIIALGNIAGLSTALFTIFIGFVSSIYYLLYSDVIMKFFVRLTYAILPNKSAEVLLKYGRNLNFYFYKYIYCQLLDCIILGTLATIGLSLIGIDQAVMFGMLLAVLNIIPYFGSIFGSIFVVVFVIFTDGPAVALITGLFLLVTQQLDGNFIQPKLMGTSLHLNPLLIIISISIGSFYFGVLGMIVAIPFATIARDIAVDLIEYLETRKEAKRLKD